MNRPFLRSVPPPLHIGHANSQTPSTDSQSTPMGPPKKRLESYCATPRTRSAQVIEIHAVASSPSSGEGSPNVRPEHWAPRCTPPPQIGSRHSVILDLEALTYYPAEESTFDNEDEEDSEREQQEQDDISPVLSLPQRIPLGRSYPVCHSQDRPRRSDADLRKAIRRIAKERRRSRRNVL